MPKKAFLYAVLLALAAVSLTACSGAGDDVPTSFSLSVTLPAGASTDSLSLSVVRDEYNAVQHYATVGHTRADSTRFFLRGDIDGRRIAVIDITGENRLRRKLYFILEPGETVIAIDTASVVIAGGSANRVYTTFLRDRQAIVNAITDNRREYLKACEDSTLSEKQESRCLRQDSILSDSLQRFTLHGIERGGLPATLIYQQFYTTLDSLRQRQVKALRKR